MNLLVDYHLHSDHSFDGKMSMEEACTKALKLDLKEIVFTDHLEIEKRDNAFYYDLDFDRYFEDLSSCQMKYGGELLVKSGVEVGLELATLEKASEIIKKYPFDFIIASVHYVQGEDPYYDDFYQNRTKEESYRLYYEETLNLIKSFSDFDVLGHLDYIKRYGPHSYEADDVYQSFDIVEEILKVLVEKGKGLEVNTSGYKHISANPMPSEVVLRRYKELGGQRITIGTDSHGLDYMGYGLEKGLKLIKKVGFKQLSTFQQRKEKLVDI